MYDVCHVYYTIYFNVVNQASLQPSFVPRPSLKAWVRLATCREGSIGDILPVRHLE